jgi:hypothetical protein
MPTVSPSPTVTQTPTATATPFPPDLVKVGGDQFVLRGEHFPVKGFNYYPQSHPWRMFNLGDWDASETERELRLGVGLGANVVRVFIDYQYSIGVKPLLPPGTPSATVAPQSTLTPVLGTPTPTRTPLPTPTLPFVPPMPEYIQNVREFLEIAGRLNLRVILTLFDSLDVVMYQPANYWIVEEYLKQVVPPFANDPRILCWDLQNEPDRAISTVGADAVIPFFKRVSSQIRQMDPDHLQTIGWIDRARGKYFPDLNDYLDFWCFHFYDDAQRLGDLISFYKGITTKPVLLEEFGLATGGPGADGQHTELDQSLHYSLVYSLIDAYKLCGSVFWILVDFPKGLAGNPPLPDDSPENHYGIYRLDYSEKPVASAVRYAWKGTG